MLQTLNVPGDAPLSITVLMINLGIGVLLSLVLRWHFRQFGSTLSNREEFSQVFPFILLTTVLIIAIVKSSLALSLGLVGALSIVRFRTPIKEPEELAYLFISIAMGLGLGANQTLATTLAGISILGVMALLKWARREAKNKNFYLSIDLPKKEDAMPERYLQNLNEIISKHTLTRDLRRFDVRQESIEATYYIDMTDTGNLSALVDELQQIFPAIGVTFLDQNRLPSV